MRRGEILGTSLQHKTKSSIRHMAEPRISDDRALKVAGVYPGRPAASRTGRRCKYTGIQGQPVEQKSRRRLVIAS